MIIDMHSHYYPYSLIEYLHKRISIPFLRYDTCGRQLLTTHSGTILFDALFYCTESRLKFMETNKIKRQLITFPGSLGFDSVYSENCDEIIPQINSDLMQFSNQHHQQFNALCGLPMFNIDKAIIEYKRVAKIGSSGVIIPSTIFFESDWLARLQPLLSEINHSGSHVLIHPSPLFDANHESEKKIFSDEYDWLKESVFDLLDQVSKSIIILLINKISLSYPNITWQFISLGGFFPYALNRIKSIISSRINTKFDLNIPSTFYFDTSSMGKENIEFSINYLGVNNIIIGTDYPVFRAESLAHLIEDLNISDEVLKKILYENSMRILLK